MAKLLNSQKGNENLETRIHLPLSQINLSKIFEWTIFVSHKRLIFSESFLGGQWKCRIVLLLVLVGDQLRVSFLVQIITAILAPILAHFCISLIDLPILVYFLLLHIKKK